MRLKKILPVTLLLFVILIGAVSATDDNLTVGDDLSFEQDKLEIHEDSLLEEKEIEDYTDLNTLINSTAEGGEVKLTKDYIYNASEDEDYKNGIDITKTLTIDGQDHQIDADFMAGIFNVAGNGVTLKNMKIYNAGSKAFSISGSNCRIIGCDFINCSCDGGSIHGGVISINSGSIINCSFSNCIQNIKKTISGGVLSISDSDVVNCIFTNCSYGCDLVYGGAIYMSSGRIMNCSFTHCGDACRSLYGGAIEGKGSIINCTFSNNSITDSSYGGDIHLTGKSNVTGSYFIDTAYGIRCNYGCVGNISNCTFKKCFKSAVAFWCEGGNVTDCIFKDCYSTSAIYIHDSYVNVIGCEFVNCSSNGEGGAIYIVERYDNIIDCRFVNCSSKKGGAIYAEDCNDTVLNCTFINCYADKGGSIYWNSQNGEIDDSNFIKSYAPLANAIYVSADNVTISNSRFESDILYDIVYGGILINCTLNGDLPVRDPANDNTLYGIRDLILEMKPGDVLKLDKDYLKTKPFLKEGVDITKALTIDGQGHKIDADAYGRIFNVNANNVTLKNIIFSNANYKTVEVSNPDCRIINCTFSNCTYTGDIIYGGVITMKSGTISDCRFTNCAFGEDLAYGGVLWVENCNVSSCIFSNCSYDMDTVYGGAIEMRSSNIVNCTFSHCGDSCGYLSGGAIKGSGNVINCTFLDCACSEAWGGAIHFEGPSTLAYSTFINCHKAVVCQYGCIGNIYDCEFVNCSDFAMMFTARESNVTNCSFKNISGKYGAIYIHVSTYVNITGCEFTDCYSENYGTIYIELSSSNNKIDDCKFVNCSAQEGGGVYIDCSNNIVKNSKFINCSTYYQEYSDYDGGAIYVCDDANNSVINCTFINCRADNGGSVFWNGENGTILNSSFINSTANSNGGAIYWNAKNGEIINSTFIGSTAKNGGAVYVSQYNDANIKDSAFEKNQASRLGGAVYGGKISNCEMNENSYPEVISSDNASVTLKPSVIISQNVSAGSNANIYIDFKFDVTDTLIVKIDKKTFAVVDIEDGIVDYTFSTRKLKEGNHIVTFDYEGDQFDKSIISGNYNMYLTAEEIPVPETIISDDGIITLEFPINATGTLTVYVNGKAMEVIDVKKKLDEFLNETQQRVEDIVVGLLKIDLSQYKGSYTVTFLYSGDNNYQAFEKESNAIIRVNRAIIQAANANVLYSAEQKYTIKVYTDKNKPAKTGKVVVKLNNKAFKTLAIKNGVASFTVTKLPGKYKLKISALGKTITKTLTVKHIVTLKSVKVKKSAKKLILQASLAKVKKKFLKNKKITFKFNGKKYTAKTNRKGVAKVTISKKVLKKLKAGKKVTYKATYLKDTVKKTSKVKK